MHDMPPIPLFSFNPSATSRALLANLAALGFQNALLCGGALRDDYLGLEDKIADYDMVAEFGAVPAGEAAAQFIMQHLPDVTDMQLSPFPGEDAINENGITLKFRLAGKAVSLSLAKHIGPMAEWVMGDAPINSIALHSDGRLLAHPLFTAHADARLYRAFSNVPKERATARLEYLQTKIPGLREG